MRDPVLLHRMKTVLIAGVVLILLSGCMSSAVIPEDRFYRLPDVRVEGDASGFLNRPVTIGQVRAGGLYRERSLLYTDALQPLELHRYRYRYWVDAPAELVREYLQDYLRALNVAGSNNADDTDNQGTAVIDGQLLRFERNLYQDKVVVTVRMLLQYQGRQHNKGPVFTQVYQREIKTADRSMQSTVTAYGSALRQIFSAFLQDVATRAQKP